MHSIHSFILTGLLVASFSGTLPLAAPSQAAQGQPPTYRLADNTSYLELSVKPAIVRPGTLVTLYIVYHNIGVPYTNISFTPEGLVAFDPPMEMPCKYYEHGGCTEITLRALAVGVVEFRAGATGEIFDDGCNCWRWGGGTDIGPARLEIVDTLWQAFLPSISR